MAAALPSEVLLGALHASEHGQIAVLPLIAMCDRWDIGGLSTNIHHQTGSPTIFIYDGHPGGVGITRRGYEEFERLVCDADRLIRECPCDDGCPSCVQSPKCGNLNEHLHKGGALELMGRMLGRAESGPRSRLAQPAEDRNGLECLCLGREALKPHELSVAEPEDIRLVRLDSQIAAAARGHDPGLDHDRIAEIGELQRLPAQLGPDLLQHPPELLGCLAAAVGLRVGHIGAAVELEVRSEARPEIRRHLLGVDELAHRCDRSR